MKCQQKYCKYNETNTCQLKEISISADGRCENSRYDSVKSRECHKCKFKSENYPTGRSNYVKYSCTKGYKLNN